MAVQNEQIQINPYSSTVPLVQIPAEQIGGLTAQPLQGNFGRKGTGALAIGDALMRGFMQGHELKEKRKEEQAKATIAAADAGADAAYQNYQKALIDAGGNVSDERAKAAYSAYQTAFDASKNTKAKFALGDKTQKGKKSSGEKDGEKKDGGSKSGVFSNFKDFFAANPHIVPQIAIAMMKPQPEGLSNYSLQEIQQSRATSMANTEVERRQQNQKIFQEGASRYEHMTQPEIEALPPQEKAKYDQWYGAKAALTPMRSGGTMYTYVVNGQKQKMYPEEAERVGATLYVPGEESKPGTKRSELDAYAKKIGKKNASELTWDETQEAEREAKKNVTPDTSSTTSSTVDASGNRTSTTSHRSVFGPPPASSPSQRTISRPPGRIQNPNTLTSSRATVAATNRQQSGYAKAEKDFRASLQKADSAYAAAIKKAAGDPELIKVAEAAKREAYSRATQQLNIDKDAVAKEYDTAVRALGGTPGTGSTQPLAYPPGW